MGQLPETLVLEAFNGSSSPPGIQLLQLLIAIQAASLASLGGGPDFDPKYYVDLPLKYPVDTTAEAFSSLPRTLPSGTISSDTLQRFLEENFGIPGSDLVACRPQDYTPEPVDFLPSVYNPEARRWALKIHSLWLLLARQVADCVKEEPNQHTLLPLQHPVIVPGERFREVYYWDSYWIIRYKFSSLCAHMVLHVQTLCIIIVVVNGKMHNFSLFVLARASFGGAYYTGAA
jgi:hypothetical protein